MPYLHLCGASVDVWHIRSSSVIIVGVPRIFHFKLLAIRTYYIHIIHKYTADISLLACRIRGERFLQTAAPVETALAMVESKYFRSTNKGENRIMLYVLNQGSAAMTQMVDAHQSTP